MHLYERDGSFPANAHECHSAKISAKTAQSKREATRVYDGGVLFIWGLLSLSNI